MLFLGTFLGGDEMSIPCTPTECSDITSIRLEKGKFDNLYVTRNITDEISPVFPDEWDFDTILYARFDGNANAGNVDWGTDTVSHILIKRREKNHFLWQVLNVKEIHKKEDFDLKGTDYTNAACTAYEYAVVPSFHGIEGNYDSIPVYSDFEDIFFVSQNGVIHTCITDGYCDMTRNTPSSTVVTINGKYPTRIRNTSANYSTGSFSGSFLSFSNLDKDYITSNKIRTGYQKRVIDFLSDGVPKLLKHFDSRMALISIDDSVSNNADGHYQNRDISFSFTEIGDAGSGKDLYENGLSDVTEEWW